ncbi:hypothetical protein O181_031464 [Austropuccinia psidii MF-1]|uniref:RNA-directed DNA polymerase n=1 Tax=Austropuccinia psidii MF-1 TaxID=1389203 RepID=A0A9Q3CVS1_9BASI|nr:hypothetical protein [Austropuccinia psidii MF-1]
MAELPSFPNFECDVIVIDTPKGEYLILGFEFLNHFNPSIDWRKGLITFNAHHKDYCDPSKSFSNEFSSSKSCSALVDEIFKEIEDVGEDNSVSSLYLFFGNMELPPSSYDDSLEELWDEEEEPEEVVKAEKPPPHNACDNHIELEGSLPPVGVIYSLSNQESDTLRSFISETVEKGCIWTSSSSTGAPVLFVKKKVGGLLLCIDYHKLNSVTRKNNYPVPPMNQLLNVFNGSSIFSKIEFHGAYNLQRIKESDEHLTAFRTKYGSYECLVMPFGITNAPASFQNPVNDIVQDLLDVYVVAFLDDIMVFSKSEEEHVIHVSTVISRLRANKHFAKASKCLFHNSSRFSIVHLQENSRLFSLSLAFPIFTAVSSRIVERKSFNSPVSSRKIPVFPSMRKLSGSVLSQVSGSGKHPIAFDIHKPIPEEVYYEIHDKELLGIFWALKRWRAFLLSLSSPFEVLTNHSSLQYFMSSKVLTSTLPDALSRWDDVYPERGEDLIIKNPMNYQQIIKQHEVQPSRYFAVKVECFSNLIDSIQKDLWQDSQYRSILQELGKGKFVQDYSLDSSSQLLLFKDWVVVPNDPKIQLRILQKHHDFPLAGHPGQEKTLKPVKRDFHWSSMTQFIKDYVSSCQQCSRNKNIHHKKFGFLKPLPIPNGPWVCLSMDFITQLPLSNSFDSIVVIVDRFSKIMVFIPTMSQITSLDLAHLFIKNIFSKHGLSSSIVGDRGSLFVSSFWTNLCQQLKIPRDLSIAYHPETNGQEERVNKILEQYLWMYFSYHQDDWNTWLPLAEFSYNNSDHSSKKQLPFFTVYGRDP